MDAHDLRWVHGFPIHWFTHYGSKAKVQHLIRCSHLAEDLADLGERLQWPKSLRSRLAAVGAGAGRRPTADLKDLSQDPNLRAMANLLHHNDFGCFGFERSEAGIYGRPRSGRPRAAVSAGGAIPCAPAHQPHAANALVLRPQQQPQ